MKCYTLKQYHQKPVKYKLRGTSVAAEWCWASVAPSSGPLTPAQWRWSFFIWLLSTDLVLSLLAADVVSFCCSLSISPSFASMVLRIRNATVHYLNSAELCQCGNQPSRLYNLTLYDTIKWCPICDIAEQKINWTSALVFIKLHQLQKINGIWWNDSYYWRQTHWFVKRHS